MNRNLKIVFTTTLATLARRAAWPAIVFVRLYQWTIRPMLGPRCRYLPHCSDYAIESFERHGLFSGGWLTAKRLGRCHPWCQGGLDPVPERLSMPWRKRSSAHFSSQHTITD